MDETARYLLDEEARQAHQDLWALRIISCPDRRCRRSRRRRLAFRRAKRVLGMKAAGG